MKALKNFLKHHHQPYFSLRMIFRITATHGKKFYGRRTHQSIFIWKNILYCSFLDLAIAKTAILAVFPTYSTVLHRSYHFWSHLERNQSVVGAQKCSHRVQEPQNTLELARYASIWLSCWDWEVPPLGIPSGKKRYKKKPPLTRISLSRDTILDRNFFVKGWISWQC